MTRDNSDSTRESRAPCQHEIPPTGPRSTCLGIEGPRVHGVFYTLNTYSQDVPQWSMCECCFGATVRGTELEPHFTRKAMTSVCRFSTPRARRFIAAGDLLDLEEFIRTRSKVVPCSGSTPTASTKWYDCGIEEFKTCEACYEDEVAESRFDRRFTESSTKAPNVCTFNQPFIKRVYEDATSWAQWRLAVHQRLSLPNCVAEPVAPSHMTFYTLTGTGRTLDGFQICETCYLDFFAHTDHGTQFGVDDLSHLPPDEKVLCSLSVNSLRYLTSKIDTFDAWWHSVKTIHLDQSRKWAHTRRQMFELPGRNMHVCESCYLGYLSPMGYASEFDPATRTDIECDLCFVSPKQEKYLSKLIESACSPRRFDMFLDAVRIYEHIPPFELCPGRKLKKDFYGYEYCGVFMCLECHEAFARPTFSSLNLPAHRAARVTRNDQGDEYLICELYSPRVRKMWSLVVAGKMRWDDLQAAIWRRRETYFRTVFVAEYLKYYMQKQAQEGGKYIVAAPANCGLPVPASQRRLSTSPAPEEDVADAAGKRRRPSWKKMLSQHQVPKKRPQEQAYDVQGQIRLLESQWAAVE